MKGNKIISSVSKFFTKIMCFLYSMKPPVEGQKNSVTYCKINLDSTTGTKFFYFQFRRFIFDADLHKYVAGDWDIHEGAKIGEWLDLKYRHQGLSNDEAAVRRGVVGPNVLELKKPTVMGSIFAEFSKPFYVYQTFMVWTWGKNSNA